MKTDYIEFKKQRELGDILSDTFAFLRAEFKPFFTTYFKIVGPFLLVMILALAAYLYFVGNIANIMMFNSGNEAANLATIFIIGLVYILSIMAVYTMSQSTVLHYIKSYSNGKGTTDFDTVQKEVYGSFWNFIGLGIMVGLSVMVGFICCIIPGIYLYVPLALSFSVLVFNRMGASDAYSYSFTLVKDEWWMTFATFFVIGIIVAIASYAFALPTAIYQWMKMGIFSGEMDAESMLDIFKDPIYILLNIVGTIGQFLLNLISVIAGVFIYFNLNEKKNFTGTYEQIENLGKTSDN
ncbi:hypothetical protein EJ994_02090 [Maribacter sp. MJ134]|uniref:hypothetical protein n=1 Tax=Maribacter sp. MJ134 TaxID=2496865 RepID=UPI000F830CB5|nr:hypothetical protein [Maribacter sp. MJ134]AZQ57653.1 hypothetical protein EJ994_02090 [Maribacter sp. MJ134]